MVNEEQNQNNRKHLDYLRKMRVLKYYVEHKHYLRHENKVNENKTCEALRCETIEKGVFFHVKLANLLSF